MSKDGLNYKVNIKHILDADSGLPVIGICYDNVIANCHLVPELEIKPHNW